MCSRCGHTIRRADKVGCDVNTSTRALGEINKLPGTCLVLRSTSNVLVNVDPEYIQSGLELRCTCTDGIRKHDSAAEAVLLFSVWDEKRSKVRIE